ncbi:ABC transporter permease [Dactylosporangium sp. NPDC051541]|uniref:ABC transporter permease n=1 Tax=Dactylosporangium sp. NPDC051541 TaxID=3363977 RepID=UPI0037BB3479
MSQTDTVVTPPAKVARAEAAAARTEKLVERFQRQGALAVLALVIIIGAITWDSFRTYDNLGTVLISTAPPALIALGMTFVIISGGIDLSVGSLYVLGGVLAAWASQYGTWAAFALPLVVCGVFGLVQGSIIAYARLAPFIVTLAGLLGARGLMLALSDEGADTYLVKTDAFKHFGSGTLGGIGYPVYLVIALFALGMLLLYRTRFGQSVYAIGGNEDAARLMGVKIRSTQIRVYVLSGVLAGLAGAINAARLGSGVTVLGTGMELDAIAAVVIGGTLLTGGAGTLGGTIAGVLLLQVIQNLINQSGRITSAWQTVISGAFIALVVVVQTYLARLRRVSSG